MEQKRLVVQISKELHSKFKAETAITGLTMSDAIIALIEIFLSNKNIIANYHHEKKIEVLKNQYELEYQIKEDGYIIEQYKKQIKK